MDNLPLYISLFFALTTLLTVGIFYKAANKSNTTLIILTVWLAAQAFVAFSLFYTETNTLPPRFLILVLPPLVTIILLFVLPKGRQFISGLSLQYLTLLHTVRIPVEVVLYWLAIQKVVPEIMTFEGRNFDVFSGITAPFIFYFYFVKKSIGKTIMLLWNFICLGLLMNIVTIAVLSAPFPFQQFAFDQPNVAVLYFPFVWLPCCIVPLVLLSHLVTIRRLLLKP